jgi:hypothetical protein
MPYWARVATERCFAFGFCVAATDNHGTMHPNKRHQIITLLPRNLEQLIRVKTT